MQIIDDGATLTLLFDEETEISKDDWYRKIDNVALVTKLDIKCATIIKSHAFEGLYMLSEVSLPETGTLETIESFAFDQGGPRAKELSIKIPSSVKKIEYQAFNRSGLTLRINPLDWVQIEFGSFDNNGVWNYQIKPADTEIKDYNNNSLVNLFLLCPKINAGAFYSCNIIKRIITNADIGEQAFKNCKELTDILFAGRCLEKEAFSMCPKLSKTVLTHSLFSIDEKVFYRSTSGNPTYVPLMVVYQGSKKQFLAIKKGLDIFQNRTYIKNSEMSSQENNKYALVCFNELTAASINSPKIYLINSSKNYQHSWQTIDNLKLDLIINDSGTITWTPENGQLITLDTAQNKRWTKYTGNSYINLTGSDTIYADAVQYERYWYY